MSSPDHQHSRLSRSNVGWLFCVLGCYWGMLIYYLGAQWSFFEQYNYGWVMPLLCGYLLWQRVSEQEKTARYVDAKCWIRNAECIAKGESLGSQRSCGRVDGCPEALWALLILCALLYAPTRLLHESCPSWRLTSWLWTLEVAGITMMLVRVAFGPKRFALTVPSVCFFLLALPWPSSLERPLGQSLMRLNTRVTVDVLQVLGIPALQKGNVIELAGGMLGIEEACSGIRSLQSVLTISAFLAVLYRLPLGRVGALVFSGAALACLLNIIRTTLLGWVATHRGISAVDEWHDLAGVIILLACFSSIWFLAQVLRRKLLPPSSRKEGGLLGGNLSSLFFSPLLAVSSPSSSIRLRRLAIALLAWFFVVEVGVELWYRVHETFSWRSLPWYLNWPRENPAFHPSAVTSKVRKILRFDEGESNCWREPDGSSWQVYSFRWLPARSPYSQVRIGFPHDPELCNRGAGWKLRAKLAPVRIDTGQGFSLDFLRFVFDDEGRTIHIFLSVAEYSQRDAFIDFLQMTHRDLVRLAMVGSRVYGRHILEIGVSGIEDPGEATVALQKQVQKLIRVERGDSGAK